MNERNVIAAPSILAANFANLERAVRETEKAGAEWIHIDIMDGHFVPNLSFGPKTVADIRPLTRLILDCHLMVQNPETHLESFAKAGADYFTFHAEAAIHSHRLVQNIREAGMKPGISIVPATPVSLLEEILPEVDMVLVLAVNPGFGGQKIIPFCVEKLVKLERQRAERGLSFLISIDGGITLENAAGAIEKGADVIVAGSSFFNAADKAAALKKLKGF